MVRRDDEDDQLPLPLGTLVRYADDFVQACDTAEAREQAEATVREIRPCGLNLELHPDETVRDSAASDADSHGLYRLNGTLRYPGAA